MTEYTAWIIVGLASLFLLIFSLVHKRNPFLRLRKIAAFSSLQDENLTAFEKGKRFIFSLGSQAFLQDMSISGISGIPIFSRLARQTVHGDQAPMVISGEGSLACLSQNILCGIYKDAMVPELFSMDSVQFSGYSGMTYLAGVLPEIHKNINGGLILFGNLRPEMAIAIDLADRHDIYHFAASDSPSSQALFYAVKKNTILGEEYFAAGSDFETIPAVAASLRAQDTLRILIIIAIIIGVVAKVLGLF